MSLNEFRCLLARWASWIYSANRASNGFSMPSYTEYVGPGSFDRTPIDDFDPEIHVWDLFFRNHPLPAEFKETISNKYLKPRGAASVRRNSDYFRKVRMIEEMTMALFDSYREQKRIADAAAASCA